jgi:hypothetical protein
MVLYRSTRVKNLHFLLPAVIYWNLDPAKREPRRL